MSDPRTTALAIRQSLGVERLGEILFKSGYFEDTRSQAQAIVKVLAGAELDFGPIASMNGIYIVNGRTTLAANLVAAAIQRSDRYRYRVVEHTDDTCVIDFFSLESGKRELLGRSEFTMQQARGAELTTGRGGANWKKFPRNMLFSRAITNGARWYTPDVFNGPVYSPEELGAEVTEEGAPVGVIEMPSIPTREQEVDDADMISEDDNRIWLRWLEIRTEALGLGIPFVELKLPLARQQLVSAGVALGARVKERKGQLALEDQRRAEGAAARVAAPWERNRQLMAEAYALGIRLRELPSSATAAEVDTRNAELEQLLEERRAGDIAPTAF